MNLYGCWFCPFAEPLPAINIANTSVTTSSLSISWGAPSGDYTKYLLSLAEVSGSGMTVIKGSAQNAVYQSLTAGTQYTVEIITQAGDQQSTKASQIFYTSRYLSGK